jgi:hypothetical protein
MTGQQAVTQLMLIRNPTKVRVGVSVWRIATAPAPHIQCNDPVTIYNVAHTPGARCRSRFEFGSSSATRPTAKQSTTWVKSPAFPRCKAFIERGRRTRLRGTALLVPKQAVVNHCNMTLHDYLGCGQIQRCGALQAGPAGLCDVGKQKSL